MNLLKVFDVAGSALSAQSMRLNTTASNLANADSALGANGLPYRAKQVVFKATEMGSSYSQGVTVQGVVESNAPARLVYDPKSPVANKEGYVSLPNVDVIEEMTNMISASRAYQNNVEVMNTVKTMMQRTLTIGQSG